MMREVTYVDDEGRHWAVLLPDGVPDSEAERGIRIGPPSLGSLRLALPFEVRLHNQLFHRRIFSAHDARARRRDIVSALMAAARVDAGKIAELYADDAEGGILPAQEDDSTQGGP